MTQSGSIPSDERIVETMIELALAAKTHRMIVAGSNSSELLLQMHRRGYLRVTTTKLCGVSCGQFDVAFVASRENLAKALETTLDGVVGFLSGGGVLVVWSAAPERTFNQTLRLALAKRSFRIESGTICENGVAICARRLESKPAALAA
jgi:hypothetical protein